MGTPTSSSGAASSSPSRTEDSARRHIASELLQTEKNFVNILNIVVEVSAYYVQYYMVYIFQDKKCI